MKNGINLSAANLQFNPQEGERNQKLILDHLLCKRDEWWHNSPKRILKLILTCVVTQARFETVKFTTINSQQFRIKTRAERGINVT